MQSARSGSIKWPPPESPGKSPPKRETFWKASTIQTWISWPGTQRTRSPTRAKPNQNTTSHSPSIATKIKPEKNPPSPPPPWEKTPTEPTTSESSIDNQFRAWQELAAWNFRSTRKATTSWNKNTGNRPRPQGPSKTKGWYWKATKITWNWNSCDTNSKFNNSKSQSTKRTSKSRISPSPSPPTRKNN